MIANLFSSFDPTSSLFNLPMNWISTALGLLILPFLFWAIPSRWSLAWTSLTATLHGEFKTLLGPSNTGGTIIFISIFSLILFNNSIGLIPYVFTRTSHLAMTLTFRLTLWISFIIIGWLSHTQHIFAHLVPSGTPAALIPFMVLIETIRNIIRPGTLAVRLSANIIAGHLILTLIGRAGPALERLALTLLLLSQILLLLLEIAVAVIQSYVFTALRTLYAREVN